MAILTLDGVKLTDFNGKPIERELQRILWDPIQAEKGGYKHFMLKEIWEQPRAIRDTTLGRVSLDSGKVFLGEMDIADDELAAASSINIAACGTSWHAALAGKYMIERLARLPVDVDYASEYRYRNPIPDRNALGLLITQSGETADTLAAQREMISLGSKTVAICNVVGAMVAREAHGAIYTHAGPEIGVASTKAFTAQLTALFLLAVKLGQLRGRLDTERSIQLIEELSRIPAKIEEVLRSRSAQCEHLATSFSNARDFLYLGRGIHFPIALEGALKLKEISYIHAEGYPAGEMKHGPNALIDETLPVVVLATRDEADPASKLRYEKTLSNIQEVTARSGRVIAVATEGDTTIGQLVEQVIYIPPAYSSTVAADRDSSTPTACLLHRRPPRLRRRSAPQPRQIRNSGIAVPGKQRVFRLMRRMCTFALGMSVTILAIGSAIAIAQSETSGERDATLKHLAYDVVSIKPSQPGPANRWHRMTADGISMGMSLKALIMSAYSILTDSQLSGLPEWAVNAQFDVEAKMDADTAASLAKLPPAEQTKHRWLMLQALLADRFGLKVHHETRELPAYRLVVAKDGLRMQKTSADEIPGVSFGRGQITARGISVDVLVLMLSGLAERTVVDKTGLTGSYDVNLRWTPDDAVGPSQTSLDSNPSFFTAVQEQLGLKLEPSREPLDTIVVDHVERPSEN